VDGSRAWHQPLDGWASRRGKPFDVGDPVDYCANRWADVGRMRITPSHRLGHVVWAGGGLRGGPRGGGLRRLNIAYRAHPPDEGPRGAAWWRMMVWVRAGEIPGALGNLASWGDRRPRPVPDTLTHDGSGYVFSGSGVVTAADNGARS
jgi:hypothetical protein